MKKIIFSIFLLIFITGFYVPVFAQTTSISSPKALIELLKEQIKVLQAKIAALEKAELETREAARNVAGTLKLIGKLKEGVSGDDVKLLQTILAADSDIYPEGIISGYYGPLTVKAVKRFQKKSGFAEVGHIGPKTLEKLNKELDKHPVVTEKINGESRHCAIVPPGHLIAPGWLRKHGGVRPIVPTCQVIPPGIAKKLDAATSTPDTMLPVISQVSATRTSATTTHIMWITNEAATSKVWYSTSTPVVLMTPTAMVRSSLFVTQHDLFLSGLTASSTYYFIVESADGANNIATSSVASFVTLFE